MPLHDDDEWRVRDGHLAIQVARADDSEVEAADKEDARSIMLALMRADAKLDTIIYLLTEDEDEDEEEENETDG